VPRSASQRQLASRTSTTVSAVDRVDRRRSPGAGGAKVKFHSVCRDEYRVAASQYAFPELRKVRPCREGLKPRDGTMQEAEERKQRLEEQKMALDYVKHVSTLATGVIVFSLAFSANAAQRSWSWLFVPGIGGQLCCLVAMVLGAVGLISAGRSTAPPGPLVIRFTVIVTALGLLSFLVGVAAIAVFLLKNLV